MTGFRAPLAARRSVFGVRADIATYGKVIGGGPPIGMVAGGASTSMRPTAVTGGTGTTPGPEVGVTFFATFVHPLALAAARAVLDRPAPRRSELQHSSTCGPPNWSNGSEVADDASAPSDRFRRGSLVSFHLPLA